MKRVYCLYRVSTLGQVEKDDIPMQRQACHEFAHEKRWQIIEEFIEKGISGYKCSADQREALQKLKQAAVQKRFEVLLVFMFDRLGRRDDETPFVVEWFVKNGIEVWSVMEGEQRFEDHIDKLLNYIRFWQASSESLKTSIRTRARMEQLIQEHGFVGGTAPYGYQLCRLGRTNKKGYDIYDLVVDSETSLIVKEIFRLYCYEREGTHRISAYLNRRGHRTKQGALWNSASVRNVLLNPAYTGIRHFGNITTDRFSHLQIIEDELFLIAQKRLKESRLESPNLGWTKYREEVLLPEQVYCMHCGRRLTITCNVKKALRADGTVATYRRLKYICINKSSLHPCNGQRSYSANLVDDLVRRQLQTVLFYDAAFTSDVSDHVVIEHQNELRRKIDQEQANLEVLKAEVVEVLRGSSAFSSALLNDLLEKSESKLLLLKAELVEVKEEVHRHKDRWSRLIHLRQEILSEHIRSLDMLVLSHQQEVARALISRVELGRNRAISIEWTFGGVAYLGSDADT